MERFEASRDDIDSFSKAEAEVFDIAKRWSNLYQNTNDEEGEPSLIPDINISQIPEDTRVAVSYAKPEEMMSDKDKTDMVIAQLNEGLITRAQAIATIQDLPYEEAEKMVIEIENDILNPNKKDYVNGNGATNEIPTT